MALQSDSWTIGGVEKSEGALSAALVVVVAIVLVVAVGAVVAVAIVLVVVTAVDVLCQRLRTGAITKVD